MHTVLVVVHLFLAVGVIGLVLMQHGKGADAGAAFGSGSSGTVFGAAGSANFLSRATAVLATLFFITSLAMAWYSMQSVERPALIIEDQKPAIEIPV
ncbi:MAG: preprotein translocase subunit SecG, partial [Sedimenticola sp.]|nr:preprotein translocase subunit SecG [Sedimenticola sp.]